MSITTPFQGSLFANDFLNDAVTRLNDWRDVGDGELAAFGASVHDVFYGFPIAGSPNESQTEDDLIWPVLAQLGWAASLRQQKPLRLRPGGRARWAAVPRRRGEGSRQRLLRGMEAL